MNIRLAHGDPAHLTNTLVVPIAKKRDVLGLEAQRLATVQQHREDAALVQLPLGGRAVGLCARKASVLGWQQCAVRARAFGLRARTASAQG